MKQIQQRKFKDEDFFSISRSLEQYHAIFYKLWEMGKPSFTEEVDRAAVEFDDESGKCLDFLINPNFWDSIDDYTRNFVICHECLHVALNHGIRIGNGGDDVQIVNIALDIVVNQLLVDKFGFVKTSIKDYENYCWLDTVFPDQEVLANRLFEYYYNLLKKDANARDDNKSEQPQCIDKHDGFASKDMQAIIEEVNDQLNNYDKNSIKDVIEEHFEEDNDSQSIARGIGAGNYWTFLKVGEVKKKRKWETVVKQWAKKYITNTDKQIEQWARLNRRFVFMNTDKENFFLPTDMEYEASDEENKKIDVWFFQDTSGSCWDLKDRFFTAAKSLPEDRFNIKMFCFDCDVYETTLESGKIYGGGTSFSIIESYIVSETEKRKMEYPFVWVITDGFGDHVKPKYPEKWYAFLSTSYKNCFDPKTNIFNLKDFE